MKILSKRLLMIIGALSLVFILSITPSKSKKDTFQIVKYNAISVEKETTDYQEENDTISEQEQVTEQAQDSQQILDSNQDSTKDNTQDNSSFNITDYISQDEEGNITFKLPDGVTYEQFLNYLQDKFGDNKLAQKTTSAIQWLYDLLNTTWFTVGGVSVTGAVLIYAIYKWKTGKNGQIVELEKQNKELKINLDDLNEFQEKTKAQVELYAKVITAILQASQNKKLKALVDEMLENNKEEVKDITKNNEEQIKVVIKDE